MFNKLSLLILVTVQFVISLLSGKLVSSTKDKTVSLPSVDFAPDIELGTKRTVIVTEGYSDYRSILSTGTNMQSKFLIAIDLCPCNFYMKNLLEKCFEACFFVIFEHRKLLICTNIHFIITPLKRRFFR